MSLQLPAPCLVILVGMSGSGKTTWAGETFTTGQVVSSDALRAAVGAGEDDQTAGPAAFELLERIVDERLRRGLTTVIDTLGFDDDARSRWIEKAHDIGMEAHAVVFDTPDALCHERNRSQVRPLPKTVLDRQSRRFREVSTKLDDENFDAVHRIATPVRPSVTAVEPARLAEPRESQSGDGHTFGLIVSRMNWPEGDRREQLTSVARRAEEAGFRDIWVMDHFRQIRGVGRPWEDLPEAYTALAFMAGVTSRIRLGTLVTGVTHRPPVVLGKMVATLDVLSRGRAICGLGAGWDDEEHAAYGIDFPPLRTRYAILEETLQMLPLLWGKGTPGFEGEHIRSTGLICYPRPIQDPPPILIGGGGEKKTLRLAAKYAQACNFFGDPAQVAHKAAIVAAHCDDLGRDPTEVEVTHLTTALAAADGADLRDRVERLRQRNTPAETYIRRNHAGTVDQLVELFAAYAAAGADHSIVAIPDVVTEGSIETFADVIRSLGPA